MRPTLLPTAVLALTAWAGACAHAPAAPPPTPPAPVAQVAPAPDPATLLPGHWTFTAQVGGEEYSGTMDIANGAQGWTARLVEAQMGEAPVSSVAVAGGEITILITAGGGPVTVKGSLQPDGTLAGKVLTSDSDGTFTAKKS